MINYLIKFEDLKWTSPSTGIQQKAFKSGSRQLRLVRFYDDFIEKNWCTKSHIGLILNGEMIINFDGELKKYKKGDGIWIEKGLLSKHKVIIEKGKHVELILFEND